MPLFNACSFGDWDLSTLDIRKVDSHEACNIYATHMSMADLTLWNFDYLVENLGLPL